jgi:hypothetical protein
MTQRTLFVLLSTLAACDSVGKDRNASAETTRVVVSDPGPVALDCSAFDSDDDVDLLFVIDNSPSMAPKQDALKARFPDLQQRLDQFAADGRPRNYHIGVVTTDPMEGPCGTWAHPGFIAQGVAAAPGCLMPERVSYIEYDQRTGINNLAAGQDLGTQFACMASVGETGCGFEMPLEAAYRALHDPASADAGFLRPNALLAVVFLTDEDDCSAEADNSLFTNDMTLGPLASFRCTRYGIVCDGQLVSDVPNASYANCVPATRAQGGQLYDLDRYRDFFTRPMDQGGVKSDPRRVMLTTIDGPSTPFGTHDSDRSNECGTSESCTVLAASCVSPTHSAFHADPAVRLNALVNAAACHGVSSICDADYSQAMGDLSNRMVPIAH